MNCGPWSNIMNFNELLNLQQFKIKSQAKSYAMQVK